MVRCFVGVPDFPFRLLSRLFAQSLLEEQMASKELTKHGFKGGKSLQHPIKNNVELLKYIKPYLFEKKAELDRYIDQLKKVRKKREKLKKKRAKRSRHSPSVYNKDEIVYKRIHIISTAM